MATKTEKEIAAKIAQAVFGKIDEAESLEALRGEMDEVFSEYGVKRRKKLAELTWQEIAEISRSGKASEMLAIGDEKQVELLTGEKLTFEILGFNHDNFAHSFGKAGITFGLKNIPDGWFEMNEDCTNSTGWAGSKMRNVYMQRLCKLLPDDLKEVIVEVTKRTAKSGTDYEIDVTADKLFLLSEVEVFGEHEYSASDEGTQYELFKAGEKRVKKRSDGASRTWWLRSPYYGNSTSFCSVYLVGHCYYRAALGTYGVVFGFCV